MKHYIDNSIAPIMAIDFDGTISIGDGYPDPHNGDIRLYAKEVINFLYDVGVKIVIWTNRKNIKDKDTDIKDKLLMKQWLKDMGVKYHTINDTTKFAPYKYYGRKLYAHMFVDDRGFGWNESSNVMLMVFVEFLSEIIGLNPILANDVALHLKYNSDSDIKYDIEMIKDLISNWNGIGDTNEY